MNMITKTKLYDIKHIYDNNKRPSVLLNQILSYQIIIEKTSPST